MLGETAKLIVDLSLKGNFTTQIGAAGRALKGFDTKLDQTQSRAYRVGQQIGTGIQRGVKIAAVGIGFLVSQIGFGLQSLIKLEEATTQTNAVIKSTGGVAGITAEVVRKLAEKYEGLNATINDEVIQAGENLILTFTNIRKEAFEPTIAAALDMSVAMKQDLQSSVIQIGKALQDPIRGVTALRRVGVQLSVTQEKQIKDLVKQNDLYGAQKIILAELNREFGGSFIAGGTTTAAKVAKFTDSIEDLQRALATALLPTLGNVADALTKTLADPQVVAGVTKFGEQLAELFSPKNLADGVGILKEVFNTARDAAPTIAASARIMGEVVKTAVGMFRSLPPEIQKLAIGAFAINKLTGGLVTNLAGGLISGVLKQLVSGVVNVSGGVVNVVGGVGAGGGLIGDVTKGSAGGVWSKVGKIIGGAFAIVAVAEIADALHGAISPEGGLEGRDKAGKLNFGDQLSWPFGPKNTPHVDLGPIKNIFGGDSAYSTETTPGLVGNLGRTAMPKVDRPGILGPKFAGDPRALSVIWERGIKAGFKPSDKAVLATYQRNNERLARAGAAATEKAKTAIDRVRTSTDLIAYNVAHQGDRIVAAINGAGIGGTTINQYTGFTVPTNTPSPRRNPGGPPAHHKAGGGPVEAGMGYIVGEEGPEWFQPHTRGKIIPHGLTGNLGRHPLTEAILASAYARTHSDSLPIGEDDLRFRASAVLDASQIRDRRPARPLIGDIGRHRPMVVNANVTVSTRDVNKSQNLKRRYGPTYTEAGAG